MTKLISLVLLFFGSFGIIGLEITRESDLVDFINSNIDVLKDEYYKEYNEVWDMNYFEGYHELYDEHDEIKAYMLIFDQGYLTVGLDLYLYEIQTEGSPGFIHSNSRIYLIGQNYYIKKNNVFVPNTTVSPDLYTLDGTSLFYDDIYKKLDSTNIAALDNFKVTYSIASDLSNHSGSNGSYSIYTRYQGNNMDCGAQAAINMLYTYELSGETGITKSMNSNTERDAMRSLMNWTSSGRSYLGITFYGIWPGEIISGMNSYLPSKYKVDGEGYFGSGENAPAIGLYYSLKLEDTAHYAMLIGSAQSDAWWIFKTNYDIISHWNENYTHASGVIQTKKSGTPSYYFVETQYRHGTYNVLKSTGAKWWEIWKPAWKLLEV